MAQREASFTRPRALSWHHQVFTYCPGTGLWPLRTHPRTRFHVFWEHGSRRLYTTAETSQTLPHQPLSLSPLLWEQGTLFQFPTSCKVIVQNVGKELQNRLEKNATCFQWRLLCTPPWRVSANVCITKEHACGPRPSPVAHACRRPAVDPLAGGPATSISQARRVSCVPRTPLSSKAQTAITTVRCPYKAAGKSGIIGNSAFWEVILPITLKILMNFKEKV